MDEGLSDGPLLREHRVGKHCQPNELLREEMEDGSFRPIGVRGSAFYPDDNGVSVAWLEHPHHGGKQTDQIQSMISCMSIRTIRKSHRLAVYRVGAIVDCGVKFGKSISINRDPLPNYKCHSLIVGIDPGSSDLFDLIAAELLALEAMVV